LWDEGEEEEEEAAAEKMEGFSMAEERFEWRCLVGLGFSLVLFLEGRAPKLWSVTGAEQSPCKQSEARQGRGPARAVLCATCRLMSKDENRAGAWISHHLVTVRCAVLARIPPASAG
jgi:hypothetical protein